MTPDDLVFRSIGISMQFPLDWWVNWPSWTAKIKKNELSVITGFLPVMVAWRPSGQFDPDIMALRAILVLTYWPFGPLWSWYTGPSGHFGPDVLALRANLVLTYWPFGPLWSWYTGPSGQFGPDLLTLRANLVPTYWPFGPLWSWYSGPSGHFGPDLLTLRATLVLIYWSFGPVWSWLEMHRWNSPMGFPVQFPSEI
mgnify:CR=1 FL=1